MEKREYGIDQKFTADQSGVTSSATIKNTDVPLTEKKCEKSTIGMTRKQVSELSQSEIAEMFFDMMINHRIMESRIEKLESRLNTVLSNNFIKKDIVPYNG